EAGIESGKGHSSELRSRIARAASRVRPGPRPGWEFRDKRSSRRFVAWASTSTGSGTRNFRLLESQLFRSTLQAVGGQDDSSSHFSLQEVPTLTFFQMRLPAPRHSTCPKSADAELRQ